MDGSNRNTTVPANDTRSSISIHRNLQWSWSKQPYNHPKRNRGNKHNRYYKYLPAVIALLFSTPVNAETVGGVSATASPVANSSGSVTNQAIQVLQGPYITNTYGGGIQCQGPTLNFTPYITGAGSIQKPWEPYYMDPVYDISDNFGAFDAEGNEIGDGIIDNPGKILFRKRTRTGQKDNYSVSVGFSATWSRPLDKSLQDQCKEAVATQIALQQQLTANKRLDFEIARLKNCGELLKKGISFHPKSPYYSVCADVVVRDVSYIKPHRHTIPSAPTSTSSMPSLEPGSHSPGRAEHLGAPLRTQPLFPSP